LRSEARRNGKTSEKGEGDEGFAAKERPSTGSGPRNGKERKEKSEFEGAGSLGLRNGRTVKWLSEWLVEG